MSLYIPRELYGRLAHFELNIHSGKCLLAYRWLIFDICGGGVVIGVRYR